MKKVVVLGGGFGGLFTVRNLCCSCEDLEITLINRDDNFIFTPLLHEVATAGIRDNNAIYLLKESLENKNVNVVAAEVKEIKLKDKKVITSKGNFNYDYLVIALGSKNNLKTPGLEKYSLGLKTIEDARKIRKEVFETFKKASKTKQDLRKKLLTFVVIGAGPTGVELAAELKELGEMLIRKRFRNISERDFSVILLQRGNSMLPQLPGKLVEAVEKRLEKLGVDLRYNSNVERATKEGIYVNKKLIPCSIKIAAVGVTANRVKTTPQIYSEDGIPVKRSLQIDKFDNVFALGDVALHKDNGKLTPRLAQAAVQEAKIVAKNIIALSCNKEVEDFKFENKGFLLSVGQLYAVAEVGKLYLKGFFAWLLWRTIYMAKVVGIRNKLFLAYDWTIGLFRRRFVNNGN